MSEDRRVLAEDLLRTARAVGFRLGLRGTMLMIGPGPIPADWAKAFRESREELVDLLLAEASPFRPEEVN